jgi:hypothetical protein
MSDQNILHVKFENDELIRSKRDLLSTEMGLLKIAKAIKNYRFFREEELKIKIALLRKSKSLKLSLKKLQTTLPKVKGTGHFIKEKPTSIIPAPKGKKPIEAQAPEDMDLEAQLRDIQDKLGSLSA